MEMNNPKVSVAVRTARHIQIHQQAIDRHPEQKHPTNNTMLV
jgi:hypothetical protein